MEMSKGKKISEYRDKCTKNQIRLKSKNKILLCAVNSRIKRKKKRMQRNYKLKTWRTKSEREWSKKQSKSDVLDQMSKMETEL